MHHGETLDIDSPAKDGYRASAHSAKNRINPTAVLAFGITGLDFCDGAPVPMPLVAVTVNV